VQSQKIVDDIKSRHKAKETVPLVPASEEKQYRAEGKKR